MERIGKFCDVEGCTFAAQDGTVCILCGKDACPAHVVAFAIMLLQPNRLPEKVPAPYAWVCASCRAESDIGDLKAVAPLCVEPIEHLKTSLLAFCAERQLQRQVAATHLQSRVQSMTAWAAVTVGFSK